MTLMYGYKVDIWRGIYHNDQFSHYTKRSVTIHDPRLIYHPKGNDFTVDLESKYFNWDGDLKIQVNDEFVANVDLLGRVHHKVKVFYLPVS